MKRGRLSKRANIRDWKKASRVKAKNLAVHNLMRGGNRL